MTVSARRQQQHDVAVDCIQRLVRERGYPPSMDELADELGFRHRSSVHTLLVELEDEGRIRRGQGPRAITVVAQP